MKEWLTLFMGIAPISELRGAIPFGLSAGLSLQKTLFLAIVGNIIPVIPLLLFLDRVSKWLIQRSKFFKFFLIGYLPEHAGIRIWLRNLKPLGLYFLWEYPCR